METLVYKCKAFSHITLRLSQDQAITCPCSIGSRETPGRCGSPLMLIGKVHLLPVHQTEVEEHAQHVADVLRIQKGG